MTFDDGQAEDEENSLPHMDGFQSKLPPGILPHGLPQVKEVQPAVTQVEQEKEKEKPKKEGRIIAFLCVCVNFDNQNSLILR